MYTLQGGASGRRRRPRAPVFTEVASGYINFNTDTNNFATFPAACAGRITSPTAPAAPSGLRAHYANIIFEIFTGSFKLSPLGITCTAVDVTRVSTALRTERGAGGRGGAESESRRRPPCAATAASAGRPRRGRTACKGGAVSGANWAEGGGKESTDGARRASASSSSARRGHSAAVAASSGQGRAAKRAHALPCCMAAGCSPAKWKRAMSLSCICSGLDACNHINGCTARWTHR